MKQKNEEVEAVLILFNGREPRSLLGASYNFLQLYQPTFGARFCVLVSAVRSIVYYCTIGKSMSMTIESTVVFLISDYGLLDL